MHKNIILSLSYIFLILYTSLHLACFVFSVFLVTSKRLGNTIQLSRFYITSYVSWLSTYFPYDIVIKIILNLKEILEARFKLN